MNTSKTSMKIVLIRAIVVVLLFFVGAVITYNTVYKHPTLPILKPADFNPKLVDESLKYSFNDHEVGDFVLINQDGDSVTPKTFNNKIYVANFIFTTCPGICPIMTKKMENVYQKFFENKNFSIISHSVTPEMDSVPVLKEYAKKHFAVAPQWHFVTGNRKLIYDLARKHYFAALDEGDGSLQDFVHTENVLLIDPQKRIRGVYDGTDDEEIERLMDDIEILFKEYPNLVQ